MAMEGFDLSRVESICPLSWGASIRLLVSVTYSSAPYQCEPGAGFQVGGRVVAGREVWRMGGSSGTPNSVWSFWGRGGPFLCSSCLPCKGGLAKRGPGHNSPASTLYVGLGLGVTVWEGVFPLLACLPLQPGLSFSQDGGGGGGDPQCRSLGPG